MTRTCAYCGREFEGPAQAKFCSDAHRKAASRIARGPNKPEPPIVTDNQTIVVPSVEERPGTLRGLIAAARKGEITLTDREEQLIRNYYGYASSEKRTLLQRDKATEKMRVGMVDVIKVELDGSVTVTRHADDGTVISEVQGPAGLSPVAFPTQTPGDLTPTDEQLAKLR